MSHHVPRLRARSQHFRQVIIRMQIKHYGNEMWTTVHNSQKTVVERDVDHGSQRSISQTMNDKVVAHVESCNEVHEISGLRGRGSSRALFLEAAQRWFMPTFLHLENALSRPTWVWSGSRNSRASFVCGGARGWFKSHVWHPACRSWPTASLVRTSTVSEPL